MAFDKSQYDQQYAKDNLTVKKVPFNRQVPDDMVLLRWLESQPEPFVRYVKKLIAQDMISRREEK